MKPYSVDLRKRALDALDRGMSRAEVVTTFQVSLPSLKRWLKARRLTGDLSPRPPTGGPALTISPEQEADLRAQVASAPDASLADHTAQWNATHTTSLSASTIGRAISRLAITRKKVANRQ